MTASRGKHVVVVTPYFHPKVGGLENYAFYTARLLNETDGYRVSVITTNHEKKGYSKEVIEGMTVHRLPVAFMLSNTPVNLLWYSQIKRIFQDEKPDVIFAHTPVPFIADVAERARGNIPFVLVYHNDLVKKSPVLNLLAKTAYVLGINKTIQRADKIVVTSKYYADNSPYMRNHFDKMAIIPPGVNLSSYNTDVDHTWLKREYGERPSALFVGQLSKQHSHKGIPVLMEAVALLKKEGVDMNLFFVGTGNAIAQYTEDAKRLGLSHVFFAGKVSEMALAGYYAGADMTVLPSTTNSEGFGMVLLESNACGTPTIGSDIGGISQAIVDGETGLLVKPNDVVALASAMLRLLSNADDAQAMGSAGAFRAREEFGWDVQTAKFRKIIDEFGRNTPPIAQITAYYPPHSGGLERVAKICADGLSSRGYDVHVITSTQSGLQRGTTSQGKLKVSVLSSVEFAHVPVSLGFVLKMCTIPRDTLLHLHLSSAFFPEVMMCIARLRGMKYVVHFHLDVGPSGMFGKLFLVYKRFVWRPLLTNAAAVIACAQDQVAILEKNYQVPPERITVIPNAVSQDFFGEHERSAHPQEKLRLLSIGRLAQQKRLDRMINAFAKLTIPAELTIVGDGEKEEELRLTVSRLGLTNVVFAGKKNDEEMRGCHRTHDIFLVTSEREGMPLAVLEAMAGGLPIIATQVDGLTELIEGTGVLVKEPYVENLAFEIEALWGNPKRLAELSAKSKEKAKQYNWEKFISAVSLVYQRIS